MRLPGSLWRGRPGCTLLFRTAQFRIVEIRTPSHRRPPHARSGLTLVEVLMSMLVTGIGILGVVALLPLAFVRAVQATNLTNGTILRYNAESMVDFNQRLLLRWQPLQAYSQTTPIVGATAGDIVLNPNYPLVAFQCSTAGNSGLVAPTWNTTPGATTPDGSVTWTTVTTAQNAVLPPARFVIDPLGWWALGSPLQTILGNNGSGAVDTNAIPRFNAEILSSIAASFQAYLPDSWVEQARVPVTSFTTSSVTLNNLDLSGIAYTTPANLATATPPYSISRVVLIDASGKVSQTRVITGVNVTGGNSTVSWGGSPPAAAPGTDPLLAGFTPVQARVETQELRYTWLLTVIPSSAGGSSNVEVTVFFHRPLAANDEQVYQATGVDGVLTPFTVNYSGAKPFAKKGGFLFDAYFGRWYRIVNVTNDTGSQMSVFVDQPRPTTDVLSSKTFGAVFMRGVVDVFPLPLK